MRRKYMIKEITCPECEGIGYTKDMEDMYPIHTIEIIEEKIKNCNPDELEYWEKQKEWYYEYHHCKCCNGKGYIIDEIDEETGYKIITIEN